jgi:hypothetical protein
MVWRDPLLNSFFCIFLLWWHEIEMRTERRWGIAGYPRQGDKAAASRGQHPGQRDGEFECANQRRIAGRLSLLGQALLLKNRNRS